MKKRNAFYKALFLMFSLMGTLSAQTQNSQEQQPPQSDPYGSFSKIEEDQPTPPPNSPYDSFSKIPPDTTL